MIQILKIIIDMFPQIRHKWKERQKRKQEEEEYLLAYSRPKSRMPENIIRKKERKSLEKKIVELERKKQKMIKNPEKYATQLSKIEHQINFYRWKLAELDLPI